MRYAELRTHAMKAGCSLVRSSNHVTIYAPKGHEFAATGTILVCGQVDDPKWCDCLAEDIDGGFEAIDQTEYAERMEDAGVLAECIDIVTAA